MTCKDVHGPSTRGQIAIAVTCSPSPTLPVLTVVAEEEEEGASCRRQRVLMVAEIFSLPSA